MTLLVSRLPRLDDSEEDARKYDADCTDSETFNGCAGKVTIKRQATKDGREADAAVTTTSHNRSSMDLPTPLEQNDPPYMVVGKGSRCACAALLSLSQSCCTIQRTARWQVVMLEGQL